MKQLINQGKYKGRIYYIQGNPSKEWDLKRCKCEFAHSIIILCNKQSTEPSEEDSRTIFQAMVLK